MNSDVDGRRVPEDGFYTRALLASLLREIGRGFEVHEINSMQMLEAIHELDERNRGRTLKEASVSA